MNKPISTNTEQIVIVGVSARAAAQSAVRAGYSVIAIDAFADADLQAISRVLPVENYPNDLVTVIEKLAAEFPDEKPWAMYTGALENHLDAIDALEKNFRLLGNSREVVGRTRNPFLIQRHLANADLPNLKICDGTEPPESGTWIRKPFRSAGGIGVSEYDPTTESPNADSYFQELVAGDAISAVFLADGNNTRLAGVTKPLIGRSEVHAAPFAYCGSIGSLRIPDKRENQIRDIGNCLANAFQLRGLFNVDFIDDGNNFFTLEINPRYSASVEILERSIASPSQGKVGTEARGFGEGLKVKMGAAVQSAIKAQWVAAGAPQSGSPRNEASQFRGFCENSAPLPPGDQTHFYGKLILFADREYHFPADWDWSRFGERVADLPTPGTVIEPGHPICTVFASGASIEACERRLFEQAEKMYSVFVDHRDTETIHQNGRSQ